MTGTIILDTSFLFWLEECEAAAQHVPCVPDFTPWQGLQRLMDAGVNIVIPNTVLRESLFTLSESSRQHSVGIGTNAQGVPFLHAEILSKAMRRGGHHPRKIATWLADAATHRPLGLFASPEDLQIQAETGRLTALSVASGEALPNNQRMRAAMLKPVKRSNGERGPTPITGTQHGDLEILKLVNILMASHTNHQPVLVLTHDRGLIADIQTAGAMAGSMVDYANMLQTLLPPETTVNFPAHNRWKDETADYYQQLARENLTALQTILSTPATMLSRRPLPSSGQGMRR